MVLEPIILHGELPYVALGGDEVPPHLRVSQWAHMAHVWRA